MLQQLNEQIQRELQWINFDAPDWTTATTFEGQHVYDVVIIGGGQSGLATAFALKKERISNIIVLDENPEGYEGPWETYARMVTLRTARKKVEQGIATADDLRDVTTFTPIATNYFDLAMLMDYWSPRRLNHHTESTSMLYALREGVRLALEETLPVRFARHAYHAQALQQGLRAMGLELFGEETYALTCVTCIQIPEGVDGDRVRQFLLTHFGVEIASSFGPLHGKIWRIGTMGYSCRKENVLAVLSALEATLIQHNVRVVRGEAIQATLAFYMATEYATQ